MVSIGLLIAGVTQLVANKAKNTSYVVLLLCCVVVVVRLSAIAIEGPNY